VVVLKPNAYDLANPAIRFVLGQVSDAAWNGLHGRSRIGRLYLRAANWRTWVALVVVWVVGLVLCFCQRAQE